MKKILLPLAFVIISAVAFAAEETTTTTTTTTSSGTITEYTPGSVFVVKETSGPIKYRYGKKVTYVTKGGKTLTDDDVRTRIKIGAPVKVYYTAEGDNRVISRVELDED
jgi:ligand-binding SRPBCC domain-containing protein